MLKPFQRFCIRTLCSTPCVLTLGFALGFYLGLLYLRPAVRVPEPQTAALKGEDPAQGLYSEWLGSLGYSRQCASADAVSYGSAEQQSEARFLRQRVHVTCVVTVHSAKLAGAVRDTWGQGCNRLLLVTAKPVANLTGAVHFGSVVSSWDFLCQVIGHLWAQLAPQLQWVIFSADHVFVIPENLRMFVAPLQPTQAHYLGHALRRWGVEYNAAQAGYVLSAGAVRLLAQHFHSRESCRDSGKHWKNEDFYLGKHLGELGVQVSDTRDELGRGRFHAYNWNQLLFADHALLARYAGFWHTAALFPPVTPQGKNCCSDKTITFHGTEAEKVYQTYYLLYRLRQFDPRGSLLGAQPAPTPVPETQVWRQFLSDLGVPEPISETMSADQFYEISRKILPPDVFNQRLGAG